MLSFELSTPAKQIEQLNGFWLIQLSLKDALPLELSLGRAFFLNTEPETELYLFQPSISSNQPHQFLAKQPLSHESLNKSSHLQSQLDFTFELPEDNKPLLLLGDNLAMANVFALAKYRENQSTHKADKLPTIAALSSDYLFPFAIKPARFLMPDMPPEAIGACTLLEDWKIQNRLASSQGLPGCFEGDLAQLLEYWIKTIEQDITNSEFNSNWQVMLFANDVLKQKCLTISQSRNWLTVRHFY